jgi:hypothetical protein
VEAEYPEFTPSYYKLKFPFFDRKSDEDENVLGESDMLRSINKNVLYRLSDQKYRPIVIWASLEIDTKSLLRSIGTQNVPEHLKLPEIVKAGQCGRILSFNFSIENDAILHDDDLLTFFQRLMVFYLGKMFIACCVEGINFGIEFDYQLKSLYRRYQAGTHDTSPFHRWRSMCLGYSVDEMIDEYMRLTNIAFRVDCDIPPVFLLNGVERLANIRTRRVASSDGTSYDTRLSLLLTQLAGRHNPLCILAGTDDSGILDLKNTTLMEPVILHMSSP